MRVRTCVCVAAGLAVLAGAPAAAAMRSPGVVPNDGGTPAVSGFTPGDGHVGDLVTVTGSDFTNASDVQFNGISASPFSVDSDTQLTANVPAGATTGPISVVTPDGTATSTDNFQVDPTPSVSGFWPTEGAAGTSVVITGSDLAGASDVQFGGASAPGFSVDSDTQITANVPAG